MMYTINMNTATDEKAIETITKYLAENPELWEDGVYCHARRSEDDDDVVELLESYRGADYGYFSETQDIDDMIEAYADEIGKDASDVATDWMNTHAADYWNESSEWLRDHARYFWDKIKEEG